jgi:hypothetical protein
MIAFVLWLKAKELSQRLYDTWCPKFKCDFYPYVFCLGHARQVLYH